MAGTSYLPLVVEVAFGADPLDTGTLTWTDISAHVKRGTGLDFSRGWDTESGEPLSGRLTFTLNNDGGDFTPGATGTYGLVRNRLPVRVSAVVGTATGNPLTYDDAVGWYDMDGATYDDAEIGTIVLWTGLVESWRITWENGVRSQVAVTCVDRWAAIRRVKFPATDLYAWESATALKASAFFPLVGADLIGATSVDSLNPSPARLVVDTALAAADVTESENPVDAILGVAYRPGIARVTGGIGGQAGTTMTMWVKPMTFGLGLYGPTFTVWGADGQHYAEVTWNPPTYSPDSITTTVRIGDTTGSVDTDTSALSDVHCGEWVHFAVTVAEAPAGTTTAKLYVNGTLALTASGSMTWPGADAFAHTPKDDRAFMCYLGIYNSVLPAADISALASGASWLQTAGQTAAARAEVLCRAVVPPSASLLTTTGTFTSTMSSQDLAGKSLGDALMECAAAEAGSLYIDTAGWPVLTARSWRVGSAVAFTIPATALSADVSWTLDDQQLCNSATVDRMVGDESAGQVKSRAEASITTYGEQNRSLSLWLHTDAQALDRANAEANMFSAAMPRSADLSVDLLSKSATIPAATLLGADICDRIAVSGMPSEAPGETEFYVESIADRVSASEWQRTFTVSPRLDFWTLQDATYGVIDSVFVLAY